jgi:hypothetical protein
LFPDTIMPAKKPSSLMRQGSSRDDGGKLREVPRPRFIKDDSVTDLLANLKNMQTDVKDSRKHVTKNLDDMKVVVKTLKNNTSLLKDEQNRNLTSCGRLL